MTDRHVLVLAGGLTHEREVSLRSGARLTEALRRHDVEVTLRDADADLLPWIAAHRPDSAVIALHGGRGENGALQGILEMTDTPFTGSRSHAARLAWDKPTAKSLLQRAGYRTPDWVTLAHNTFRDLGAAAVIEAIVSHMGLPLMLKPHQGGSALGAAVVQRAEELPAALVGAFAYGSVVMVERFVTGTELAISVIEEADGPRALPAVEIDFPGEHFDYESRYTAGTTTYYTPARLTARAAAEAAELAVAAHTSLGLRDVSRTDAIVDSDGAVRFLEANVSPGLTETSMLPMAVTAAGLDLGSVYADLIERAVSRGPGSGPLG